MKTHRREFEGSCTALAAASTPAAPAIARSAQSANDRFRVSGIGMRRGLAHASSLARLGKRGDNVEVVSVGREAATNATADATSRKTLAWRHLLQYGSSQ